MWKNFLARWFDLQMQFFCVFLLFDLSLSEAKTTIPSWPLKDFAHLGFQRIDLTGYELNEGTGYELSFEDAQEFLPFHELVIWHDDFKNSSQSDFVSVSKMKDLEGNPLDLEQSLQIYEIDFDGDLNEEILLVPRIIWGNSYRVTILKKFFDYYQPVAVSQITGDCYYVEDVRDLNQDQHLDLILGVSSGASSYQDMREVFWFSDNRVQNQVFNQWIRLRDFNGDGIFELLVDSTAGTSGPHSQWAYWTDIYTWNGRAYVENNTRYPEYYEKELIPAYISEILSYPADYEESKTAIMDRMTLIHQAQEIIQSGKSLLASGSVEFDFEIKREKNPLK